MAPAVSHHPSVEERTGRVGWRGEDTTVAEVLAQIEKLRMPPGAGHGDGGATDHPHPRGVALNLIVVAPDGPAAAQAARMSESVSAHHPFRVIVLCPEPDRKVLTAEVEAQSATLVEGVVVQHERISLWLPADQSAHLLTLAEPLLIEDLATYLWWIGEPPLTDSNFCESLRGFQALVVDSAAFQRPSALFDLSRWVDEIGDEVGIADFQWVRHRHWRELLAQIFNPPSRRALLAGISRIEVDYRMSTHRGPVPLLTGWLESRLGWTIAEAFEDPNGAIEIQFSPPPGGPTSVSPVVVVLRPVPTDALAGRDIVALRLHARAGDQVLKLVAWRDREQLDRIHVEINDGNHEVHQLRLVDLAERGELLLGCLVTKGHDPIYRQSLACATRVLQAVS